MNPPVISLVVLAWDQRTLTERCVASLRRNTDVPHELIIVDNGSAPDAADYARAAADIAVLNDENLGFAAGMNRGLAAATGHYVAFINNDTEFPPGWASRLVDTFATYPDAGIVLPAVTAAGNPYAVRTEPGTERIVVPPFRHLPSGVVYVLERETATDVGGWSEEFTVASREDLDLLFKVWVNQRRVILDERVLVHHESSATADTQLPDRRARWEANWDVFVAKWTAADPDSVPRLASCPPEDFMVGLEQARVAATWMERWYAARFRTPPAVDHDQLARLREERDDLARRLELAVAARSTILRSLWSTVRRIVPKPVREQLFPKMRGLYYMAFPERRGGPGRLRPSAAPEQPGDDVGQGLPPRG